jgi:hypothetical protein
VNEGLLLARNRHDAMSDLSPLSGAERKSDFEAGRSVDDPIETSVDPTEPGSMIGNGHRQRFPVMRRLQNARFRNG